MANIIIKVESCTLSDGYCAFYVNAYPDDGFGGSFPVKIQNKLFSLTSEEINSEIKSESVRYMIEQKMIESAETITLLGGAS